VDPELAEPQVASIIMHNSSCRGTFLDYKQLEILDITKSKAATKYLY